MKNHVIKTSLIIAALVLTGCTSNVTESKTESVQQVSYTKDSILDLITGIEDRYVLLNSENIDFMTNVSYVGDEIKSISVDAKDVDYNTPGTYSITYTIILSKGTDAINLESGNSYTKEVKVIFSVPAFKSAQALVPPSQSSSPILTPVPEMFAVKLISPPFRPMYPPRL